MGDRNFSIPISLVIVTEFKYNNENGPISKVPISEVDTYTPLYYILYVFYIHAFHPQLDALEFLGGFHLKTCLFLVEFDRLVS